MVAASVPLAFGAKIVETGTCGENVTYMLDSDGVLTISGTGDMENYYYDGTPFSERDDIKTVIIENGVMSIGDYAFYWCGKIVSIKIPDSVTSIYDGNDALSNAAVHYNY